MASAPPMRRDGTSTDSVVSRSGFRLLRRTQTVRRTVEEVYLRDDIGCGFKLCTVCAHLETENAHPPPLRADATHYAIPDAGALSENIDAWLAAAVPDAGDVILLTSEVSKARLRGDAHVKRSLWQFNSDPRLNRGVKLFPNDNFRATSTVISASKRNEKNAVILSRADGDFATLPGNAGGVAALTHTVLRAAAWYTSHVANGAFPVVVVTDDPVVLGFSNENLPSGVVVRKPSEYFPEFRPDSFSLQEYERVQAAKVDAEEAARLDARNTTANDSNDSNAPSVGKGSRFQYPAHWSLSDVSSGLLDGTLVKGVVKIHPDNADLATVVMSSTSSIRVSGSERPIGSKDTFKVKEDSVLIEDVDELNEVDGQIEDDDDDFNAFHGGDVFIPSRLCRNRAMDGDEVAVRFLPTVKWVKKRKVVGVGVGDEDEDEEEGVDDNDDFYEQLYSDTEETVPTGEVVGILRAKSFDLVATVSPQDTTEIQTALHSTRTSNRNYVTAIPVDRKAPRIRLFTRRAVELVGKRLLVRVDGWRRESRNPDGRVVQVLGAIGDIETETKALLIDHGIIDQPFSVGAVNELPKDGDRWVVPTSEFRTDSNRVDARNWRTMSIDPPGCVDVDDAVSVRKVTATTPSTSQPKQAYEITVHIADVSFFVLENSVLDSEARAQGTTTYLTDRRIDMLPELLSADLASLLQDKDRLAMFCMFTVDSDTFRVIKPPTFGRSVINNKHQLSYYEAQGICDRELTNYISDIKETQAIAHDLDVLVRFADALKESRMDNGAIELSSAELRFETSANAMNGDEDKTSSRTISRKTEVPMMGVVAELMIAANAAVASKIIQSQKLGGPPGLLRKHEPPLPEKFEELAILLKESTAVALDASSGKALSLSLNEAEANATSPSAGQMFRSLALRAMSEAQYVNAYDASYDTSANSYFHYGLAVPLYAHFTSPIRRYADLCVHRQLWQALVVCGDVSVDRGIDKGFDTAIDKKTIKRNTAHQSTTALSKIADHLNLKTRSAKVVQRKSVELKVLASLSSTPEIFQATVRSVSKTTVILFVPTLYISVYVNVVDRNGHVMFPRMCNHSTNETSASNASTKIVFSGGIKALTFVDKNTNSQIKNAPIIKTGASFSVELSASSGATRAARIEAVLLDSNGLEGFEETKLIASKKTTQPKSGVEIERSVASLSLADTVSDKGVGRINAEYMDVQPATVQQKNSKNDSKQTTKFAFVFGETSVRGAGDTSRENIKSSQTFKPLRTVKDGGRSRSEFIKARACAADAYIRSAATRSGGCDGTDVRVARRKRRAAVAGLRADAAKRVMEENESVLE